MTTRTAYSQFISRTADFMLDDEDYKAIIRAAQDRGFTSEIEEIREAAKEDKPDLFAELAEKIRYEALRSDILSIDAEIKITVLLGCGGPTDYLSFPAMRTEYGYESTRNATYITTDTPDHSRAEYELSESETAQLWEAFSLESYSE